MLRTYFKIAWRSIARSKFYSAVNITGLALAIACGILVYLYTSYHLSFDSYHNNADKIYRVVHQLNMEKTEYEKGSSVAVYEALRTTSPQVQQAAVMAGSQSFIVSVDNYGKRFKEDRSIAFTTPEWFRLFSYDWVNGSAASLNEPNTAVLTHKQAIKYFGTADAMGKTISINKQQLKVVGILADAPYNTDTRSEVYLSLKSYRNLEPKIESGFFTDWGYMMSTNSVFVALNSEAQKQAVEQQLALLTREKLGTGAKFYTFKLLPLRDAHFDPLYGGKVQKPLLVTLVVIGLLIVSIAVINYINLTIAGQTRRSVEIGTRKVLGGSVRQLFIQFMVESLLNALIAVIIAVGAVILFLPTLNGSLFNDEPVHILSYGRLALFLLIALLIIAAGTGIYPAFMLSRSSIFSALKNNLGDLRTSIGQKILILLQNVVAQGLIACTIIMVMQVRFLRNTDMGFDREGVVILPVGNVPQSQKQHFAQTIQQIPGVLSYSWCRKPPSSDSQMGATVKFDDREWEKWPARYVVGDTGYCKTFGLKIVAGRNIREGAPQSEYLVNETMVKMLHFKDPNDILGKKLLPGDVTGVIVGVMKDFNVRSLMEPIEPSVLLQNKDQFSSIAVKLSGQRTAGTLQALEQAFDRDFPEQVFSYRFVDEEIAALYKTQTLQQKLIWGATFIAIFVSSLGLLGLISLITLHRTKEIGIRKVLGASVAQISMLLSKQLLSVVLLALTIACPVAWWLMNNWLQKFAYRIDISWWVFGLAAGVAVLIAMLTVSFRSVKAAMANPIKSLRSE